MRGPCRLLIALVAVALTALGAAPALAQSRIKDIVEFEGVRDNMLVGYGLVVGLNGTGDTLRNAPFTKQSLEAMLERLGVNVRDVDLNTKNVAAVMVTARLPAFAASGSQIDATVSAMGDAKSLLGGTLLVTPLMGADGQAYAVSQGTVQTGAVSASGGSGSVVLKGVPTAGRIAAGAIVEREVGFQLASLTSLRMTLRNPDFTTAQRIAQGNLTISVQETPQVSQPAPFSQGQTKVVSQSAISVDEEKGKKLIVVREGASLSSLVAGLNALGVTPRDMISILQTIKAAGALQADIQVM